MPWDNETRMRPETLRERIRCIVHSGAMRPDEASFLAAHSRKPVPELAGAITPDEAADLLSFAAGNPMEFVSPDIHVSRWAWSS